MKSALLSLLSLLCCLGVADSAQAAKKEVFRSQAILSRPTKNLLRAKLDARLSTLGETSFLALKSRRLLGTASVVVPLHRTSTLALSDAAPFSNARNPCRAAIIKRFLRNTRGYRCEPDWTGHITATPNDTMLSSMYPAGTTATGRVHLPEAWDLATGSTSTAVGIIDTGTDYNHPDLASNIWTNPDEIPGNSIDDDNDGYIDNVHGFDYYNNDGDPMDDHNHGTAVAGVIGAIGNNSRGVVGVNWAVTIVPCKAFGASGTGSMSAVIQCLGFLINVNTGYHLNMVATNNSYGGFPYSSLFLDTISATKDEGMGFIAGAGNNTSNNDSTPFYPASYAVDNIISVAATDSSGVITSISNYGASSVHIAAPGEGVLTTIRSNQYGYYQGTSIAAPHVTGAYVLLRTYQPGYTYSQAKEAILQSGTTFAGLSGKCSTSSILNVGAALTYALAATPTPTSTPDASPTASPSPAPTATATPSPGSPDLSSAKLGISATNSKSKSVARCDLTASNGSAYEALEGYRVNLITKPASQKLRATTNAKGRTAFTLHPSKGASLVAHCTANFNNPQTGKKVSVRSRAVTLRLR